MSKYDTYQQAVERLEKATHEASWMSEDKSLAVRMRTEDIVIETRRWAASAGTQVQQIYVNKAEALSLAAYLQELFAD